MSVVRLNFPGPLRLFLCLSICLSDGCRAVSGVYTDNDLLMPYPDEDYNDNRVKVRRSIGSCRRPYNGTVNFQEWISSRRAPGHQSVDVQRFVVSLPENVGQEKWVYGLWTVVDDPVRLVTVLEPGGPGGCAAQRRETVTATTISCGGCVVAVNAGFFRPATGACIGAVISNTQQVPGTQFSHNAAFGIRHDGSLVFGYVPPESVEQHGYWREFVAGVGWLVRNGKIYISESKEQECSDTQETGTIDRFINALSARTVVGHDSHGRLIIVHIEGHTDHRGMNLWELADFLVRQGVINAINLDGGGSATFVVNGTLVSYPSDACPHENMWRCERPVSTVLCVRAPERVCQPPCLHGHCVNGVCHCDGNWAGIDCNTPSCLANCSGHGVCTAAGCECDPGWMGSTCAEGNDTHYCATTTIPKDE
uniref:N-acetylglucosamine-1-phosphodiester alpha-N-acetylglucosaminidase n=1 Tax=Eptatretus burgeri TaxID=7764 RepID=A0A8C4QDR4_EPTBU